MFKFFFFIVAVLSFVAAEQITVKSSTVIAVDANVFGQEVTCSNETVKDCLYNALGNQGIDPTTVSIVFDPASNTLNMNTGVGDIACTSCPTEQVDLEAPPAGSYCGGISGIFTMKIKVDNATDVDISANVFGQAILCTGELYKLLANNTMVVPGLTDPKDCLFNALSNQGIDPTTVSIVYSPAANTLTLDTSMGNIACTTCANL